MHVCSRQHVSTSEDKYGKGILRNKKASYQFGVSSFDLEGGAQGQI